jgi:S-adenosylmethionine-diacylglycerol 3-amino-3-carboxypropyl transferase
METGRVSPQTLIEREAAEILSETLERLPAPAPARPAWSLNRTVLPGARDDRLFFAQVREDPLLEIDALSPLENANVIVVSSGGCTAFSLLAAGAARVTAVDLNRTQNHLVELKAAALRRLTMPEVMSFCGVARGTPQRRARTYETIRPFLSERAARFWDEHQNVLGRGALTCGVTERFIGIVARAVRLFIHDRARIERLLSARSLEEQREIFHREWNSRRWRALFSLLLNRWTFNRAFDPAFFREVENPSFAAHFRGLLEHALCDVPVRTNYFLHQMLRGTYPVREPGGAPPYLDRTAREILRTRFDDLYLVDGSYRDYLATCPESSVDALAISNICEWLDAAGIDQLFAQIVRVAKPGARFCFRNFVGHTAIPERFREVVIEDEGAGCAAIARDRSCLQARIAICRIEK